MAKVNKLALVRLALHESIKGLDTRELLCVLADIYTGNFENNNNPRWYGANGGGPSGLEQGVYNYMTTFRRISDLWSKITDIVKADKEVLKQEQLAVRNLIVGLLEERNIDLKQIEVKEAAAANE